MNIRAIFNHSMSVIFSITTYMFIYKLITINYTHIHTGSFETDLVYWVSVINSIFLMIMIVTSMVFIYYYATDKGYIVHISFLLFIDYIFLHLIKN